MQQEKRWIEFTAGYKSRSTSKKPMAVIVGELCCTSSMKKLTCKVIVLGWLCHFQIHVQPYSGLTNLVLNPLVRELQLAEFFGNRVSLDQWFIIHSNNHYHAVKSYKNTAVLYNLFIKTLKQKPKKCFTDGCLRAIPACEFPPIRRWPCRDRTSAWLWRSWTKRCRSTC